MSLRIVNNKRIDMTDDEFKLFQGICESYSRDNFNGKELFNELFETDEDGLIICLKPPTKMFSFEVTIFLLNLMTHQHLRKIYKEHDEALKEVYTVLNELKSAKKDLNIQNSQLSSAPKE